MAQGVTTTAKSNGMAAKTPKTPPKTPTKRGAGAGSTSDIDTIIPLLFAGSPGIIPNYNKMSALDEHGRTASALEHKFRKWRQVARDILAAHPEEAGSEKVVGQPNKTKNPRSSKKGKQANGGAMVDDDESFNDMVNGKKQSGVKEDSEDGESKKTSPKKRSAGLKTGDESPSKKAKGRQNGKTAAIKKSPTAKKTPRSGQPPVTEDGLNEDAEELAVKEEDGYISADEGETKTVEMSFVKV